MIKQIFTREEVKTILRKVLGEDFAPGEGGKIAWDYHSGLRRTAKDVRLNKERKKREDKKKKTTQQNESIQDNKTYTREEVEALIIKDREARNKQ